MKYIILLASVFIILSCESKGKKVGDYMSYGEEITEDNVLTQNEMLQKYQTLQPNDTLNIKFKSEIKEVCQMMGCWVKLELDPKTESKVNFKNHEFSIPKDSDGKEAIVSGKAFLKTVSVEKLKHEAKDAGKSEKEIQAITSPEQRYEFIADGILVK